MSVNQRKNVSYGVSQALVNVSNPPIVSKRAPSTRDKADIGTTWIDTVGGNVYTIVSIIDNSAAWVSTSGGGGGGGGTTLSSLTVTPGNATIASGSLTVAAGSVSFAGGTVNIGTDAATNAINIGTAGTRNVTIGSSTATSQTFIQGGAASGGGLMLNAHGSLQATSTSVAIASPTNTATNQATLGQVQCTGFTTAASAAQVITITHDLVTVSSLILATATNDGSNDAEMHITQIKPAAGSFAVTLTNAGSQALNGSMYINYWIATP